MRPDYLKKLGEQRYIDMLDLILDRGQYRKPEGEEGRYESFGQFLEFDLSGMTLPLFTTKKVQFRSLAAEMLWFLSGSQNIRSLQAAGVSIWNPWANEKGDVGPLYGYMWRHWHTDTAANLDLEVDQMSNVMESLRFRPEARSHVVVAYRPDWLCMQSIKPCHVYLQFYLFENRLELLVVMRSWDAYLGAPFNIAQFALLAHMVAHQLGCQAERLVFVGCDTHIYENHVEQVRKQLQNPVLDPPNLRFTRKPNSLFEYTLDDFEVVGYQHAEFIPAGISVQGRPGQGVAFGDENGN